MTCSRLAAGSLLLLAACAANLPQTPPPGRAAQVAAPDWRAGSTWRYAISDGFTKIARGTVDYRVRGVAGDVVTVDVQSGGQESVELYTREGNWLRRPATNMQTFTYRPAYRAFDFPLFAGKSWTARSTATDPADGRSFPLRLQGRVLGWERIKVPAGEFDTLKVQRMVYLDFFRLGDRGQSVIQETDWYAPDLQHVVRRETTSQYLKLARIERPFFVKTRGGDDHSRDDILPRYEQDDWLVYELVARGGN
ncbi:MAG: hypothetical protein IT530_00510 [Burkholderiales bacterium]|nr:hypothetical protein [Burkholderiales bacterium]